MTIFIATILIIGCAAFALFILSLIFGERPSNYEPVENVEAESIMHRIWKDEL